MKKHIIGSIALLLCLWPSARAQEMTYALPSTTLTVEVEVEQTSFFAGPYANYARKFLNMDVKDRDAVSSAITAAQILPRVEADGKALYTTEPDNAALLSLSAQGLVAVQPSAAAGAWRFLPPVNASFPGSVANPIKEESRVSYKTIQTEDNIVQVPVEHKVKSAKSMEDMAAEAAEMILSVRKDRLNIVSGNTDASYSGEAMGAALKELDRIEKEYMALFQGYTVKRTFTASFDVVPEQGQHAQRYLVFRLTDNARKARKESPITLNWSPSRSPMHRTTSAAAANPKPHRCTTASRPYAASASPGTDRASSRHAFPCTSWAWTRFTCRTNNL